MKILLFCLTCIKYLGHLVKTFIKADTQCLQSDLNNICYNEINDLNIKQQNKCTSEVLMPDGITLNKIASDNKNIHKCKSARKSTTSLPNNLSTNNHILSNFSDVYDCKANKNNKNTYRHDSQFINENVNKIKITKSNNLELCDFAVTTLQRNKNNTKSNKIVKFSPVLQPLLTNKKYYDVKNVSNYTDISESISKNYLGDDLIGGVKTTKNSGFYQNKYKNRNHKLINFAKVRKLKTSQIDLELRINTDSRLNNNNYHQKNKHKKERKCEHIKPFATINNNYQSCPNPYFIKNNASLANNIVKKFNVHTIVKPSENFYIKKPRNIKRFSTVIENKSKSRNSNIKQNNCNTLNTNNNYIQPPNDNKHDETLINDKIKFVTTLKRKDKLLHTNSNVDSTIETKAFDKNENTQPISKTIVFPDNEVIVNDHDLKYVENNNVHSHDICVSEGTSANDKGHIINHALEKNIEFKPEELDVKTIAKNEKFNIKSTLNVINNNISSENFIATRHESCDCITEYDKPEPVYAKVTCVEPMINIAAIETHADVIETVKPLDLVEIEYDCFNPNACDSALQIHNLNAIINDYENQSEDNSSNDITICNEPQSVESLKKNGTLSIGTKPNMIKQEVPTKDEQLTSSFSLNNNKDVFFDKPNQRRVKEEQSTENSIILDDITYKSNNKKLSFMDRLTCDDYFDHLTFEKPDTCDYEDISSYSDETVSINDSSETSTLEDISDNFDYYESINKGCINDNINCESIKSNHECASDTIKSDDNELIEDNPSLRPSNSDNYKKFNNDQAYTDDLSSTYIDDDVCFSNIEPKYSQYTTEQQINSPMCNSISNNTYKENDMLGVNTKNNNYKFNNCHSSYENYVDDTKNDNIIECEPDDSTSRNTTGNNIITRDDDKPSPNLLSKTYSVSKEALHASSKNNDHDIKICDGSINDTITDSNLSLNEAIQRFPSYRNTNTVTDIANNNDINRKNMESDADHRLPVDLFAEKNMEYYKLMYDIDADSIEEACVNATAE